MGFKTKILNNFGGEIEILNFILLGLLLFWLCSFLYKIKFRIPIALVCATFASLQLASLYFLQSFIGYRFYIHFNVRDTLSMSSIYWFQLLIVCAVFTSLFLCFFYSFRIKEVIQSLLLRILKNPILTKTKGANIFISFSLAISSAWAMTLPNGIISKSYELTQYFKPQNADLETSLKTLGFDTYTSPEEIIASGKKKNIIILSLESLERGYFSPKYEHLTPHLSSIKDDWTYLDMSQNHGSGWTAASLYTSFTGFPAFFGVDGNDIFQNAFHTELAGIPHLLKKLNYDMSFMMTDARYAGTQELLSTYGIKQIIDSGVLGKEMKDLDLFEKAKKEILQKKDSPDPFFFFISTFDSHDPGNRDDRLSDHIPDLSSDLEFAVGALDHLIGDFISFLEDEGLLSKTSVFIFPDHLKFGDPTVFRDTGDRSLYFISNALDSLYEDDRSRNIFQIDMPELILKGAEINHNLTFLSDIIDGSKNDFIKKNTSLLTNINTSGISRINTEPIPVPIITEHYTEYSSDHSRYIAHAGGKIDNHYYTNSLEALKSNYAKGFKLFELDIIKTSDGHFVAAHDWNHWSAISDYTSKTPPSLKEFLSQKIHGQYTPLDITGINSWFSDHPDAVLVTDKINEPLLFSKAFIDKNRLMMELFTMDAVLEGISAGILSSMPSESVINSLGSRAYQKLSNLNIDAITLSRKSIKKNKELIIKLRNQGLKTYVYSLDHSNGIDEEYVTRFEMDVVHGVYADEWNF